MVEKPNYRAPVPNLVVGSPSHSSLVNLSLSVCLSNTHRICLDQYISYFYLYQAGVVAGFTLGGGGWISNLIIYLIQVFNLKNINAAQISNIVSGSTNLLPVIGAIVADSFFGTFSVAAVFSCISLLVILFTVLQLARCTVCCVCSLLARLFVVRLSRVTFNFSI